MCWRWQAWIASAFYLFILITSKSVSLRIAKPADRGPATSNPVLQDIGLAVHPPMLYLGYVGFSISFSFGRGRRCSREGSMRPGRAGCGRGRSLAWIFLTLGHRDGLVPGPITNSAGAAGGSGTRSRMLR